MVGVRGAGSVILVVRLINMIVVKPKIPKEVKK